jgi:hypothetical protein
MQSIHNKAFTCKVFDKQVSPGDFPGLTWFYILIIADGAYLICDADVVGSKRFRYFWDLTCDFWAENGERKINAGARAIESVASFSGFALT